MITIDRVKNQGDDVKGMYGLSTDTKPTTTFNEIPIRNGFWFYEIDTQDLYMFNEASSTWVKQ